MTQDTRSSKCDLVFIALGVAGITTIALPLASGVLDDPSPLDVILRSFRFSADDWVDWWWVVCLSLSFFMTIPISVASLRATVFGRFSGTEARCAWLTAGSAACIPLAVLGSCLLQGGTHEGGYDALVQSVPPAVLIAGAGTIVLGRRELPQPLLAVMALQWAFIANAVLCLILVPWEAWSAGAYLTLVTVIIYLVHIATVLWRVSGRRETIAARQVSSTIGGTA